ncbi:MAG: CBS domain-containing protein, partial [Gaiellaceae bacterium]
FTTYPVLENGRVVGLLPFSCVARVPRSAWERTNVRDCMLLRANIPVVREDEAVLDALDEMSDTAVGRALVMNHGRLEGLLSMTDVARLISWKTAGQR